MAAKKKTRRKAPKRLNKRELRLQKLEQLDLEIDRVSQAIETASKAIEQTRHLKSTVLDATLATQQLALETQRLVKSVIEMNSPELKAFCLVECRIGNTTEGKRLELFRGEERSIDFQVETAGLVELTIQNFGRSLCIMTQCVCTGRIFAKGSIVRAWCEAEAGELIQVKVYRP